MRCADLMKKDVKCIDPAETVQKAAALMRDHNVGFLPVCGADRQAIGVLTDRDIVTRVVSSGFDGATPVADVMTKDIVGCRPDDDIRHAEKLMVEREKSRMLVRADDGAILGVISLSDIVRVEEDSTAAAAVRGVTGRESRAFVH